MKTEWDMHFAESGHEALKIMATAPFDVVVSDMRMPVMDGAQFLYKVMKQYPQSVRIILSGQSEKEIVLKSVGPTHQYLAKPCDSQTLINTIKRACALRGILNEEPLKSLISRMGSLPSLPSLYIEIIEELRSPSSSINRVGDIISRDIGMTAKVLQLVNSAFFGLPQHVSTPAQAVRLLGLDTIRGLVLTVNIFSRFKKIGINGFSLDRLRDHSLVTAVFAREIAGEEVDDPKVIEDSFLVGIMHDVGRIVLAAMLPEKYEKVLELMHRENKDIFEVEKRIFRATHAEVGAYLLGLWGLPQFIVEAVCYHHYPARSSTFQFSPLTAVHVANAVEKIFYSGNGKLQIDAEYLTKIGLIDRLPGWKNICHKAAERRNLYESKDPLR